MRSRDTVNTQLKTSPPQTIFCLSVCFCRWKSIWNELKKSSFTLRWAAKIDASEMVIVLCYRGLFHVGVCFGAKYFTIIEPLFIQEYPWLPGANCSSPGQGFFQIGFLFKAFCFCWAQCRRSIFCPNWICVEEGLISPGSMSIHFIILGLKITFVPLGPLFHWDSKDPFFRFCIIMKTKECHTGSLFRRMEEVEWERFLYRVLL